MYSLYDDSFHLMNWFLLFVLLYRTIPAPLLEKLAASTEPLEQKLRTETVTPVDTMGASGKLTEKEFRFLLNMDGCGTDKLAEGIRAFVGETEKLEQVLRSKVQAMVASA